ncbi:GntR family transcriptional regulator [Stagnihabitans tardus]|uniref:FCD domain-containing protein n=1 Tax=Stagnihabitans tardus TaxID=2699202 RepID=A0AAE4Y792_9RHOB|nr:GntR family transcriptional regulator [Stagnihabitans tardus]NBZ87177.1 FCD domain-containing protein [Stagnihabitans tardus]
MKHDTPLLSDLAYQRILEALFDARLAMGARLTQGALIAVTGVPLGPVRDALKLLEADGIVTVHPRSGIQVIGRSTDLVRQTYQFRAMLERPAARAFAMTAPEPVLRDMMALHDTAAEGFAAADPNADVGPRLSQLEGAFHSTIIAALGNELVDASYRRLQLMARIIRVKAAVYPRAALVSVGEHREVIAACLIRDETQAEAAMARHLTNALNRNLGVA